MRQIHSYQIHLSNSITLEHIIQIHQDVAEHASDVYLYQGDQIADAKQLPNLLSFFMVKEAGDLLLIIDGVDVEEIYNKIVDCCNEYISHVQLRYKDEAVHEHASVVL
ncbi:hypothetical protein N781_03750 [Pontibacillus halophilus JSM 076056 = DSM 19796]|uniref:HPr domain-containing protein n=1 Tax=Pontibacillus halophilus JSM 076056 = DSM 19796 TaxID=1385510 RepID=A0A0A5GKJ2_9BACI|nr:hypothetical protein [Pontibacillus halophilus]KGX91680.1 hypothetical protein N781_03750 [Pontibacillus halophilus JSM 076056 = DSM 19796]